MSRRLETELNGIPFVLTSTSDTFKLSLAASDVAENIRDITITLKADTETAPEEAVLTWAWPMVKTHYAWHPGCTHHRISPIRSPATCTSRATFYAPVLSLYGADGTNACTLSFSDCLNRVQLSAGLVEETAGAECKLKLFTEPCNPLKEYTATLRIDTRPLPFHKVLKDVSAWWETLPGQEPGPVPEHARLPMYSTWYSFHQRLTPAGVEKQCRLGAGMGMRAVIVDDGWQTDDNNRGYAYCGDWKVTENKMPGMREHVARVQAMGMKYIVWFSVPFVGIHAGVFPRFKDKLINRNRKADFFVLDPRFPDVREYLITTYEEFMRTYGVDGFKLDFVDEFKPAPGTPVETGNGRDYDSIQAGVDRLMSDVITRLRKIKPDVLIEFRQAYVGPLMRKYGNMLRALDVPGDIGGNRKNTLDIRLLSGTTPAHADMFMWHPDEPVESAAQQILHTLFAVPQVSVLLDAIPEDHRRMVAYLMAFWTGHRDLLLDGEFDCPAPHMGYPAMISRSGNRALGVAFTGDTVLNFGDVPGDETVLVNATLEKGVVFKVTADAGMRAVKIVTCTGETVNEGELELTPGVHELAVPAAGIAFLTK